jgi:polysaccharide lyase family 4-like protein
MKCSKMFLILKSPRQWVTGVLMVGFLILGINPLHAKEKYKEVEVSNGGTIKGKAKWKGDIPKLPPISVFKHMDKCGQTVVNPALVVDPENKGVKFVAVYLKGEITEGKPLPDKKEKIKRNSSRVLHAGMDKEQRSDSALCNFEEHVFAFARTRKIGFYNMEDLLHNPHAFGSNGATLFNIPLPDPNRMTKKKLKRVKGVNRMQCDTHVHMNGWILGFSHPYFAVTNSKGQFEIAQIPPGKYTLVAWHEGYNIKEFAADSRPVYDEPHIFEKEIEVKAGETIELNFEFPERDVKVEYKVMGRTVEGH